MSALLLAVLCATGVWPAFSQTSPIYAWTNFVGQPGGAGSVDGTGTAARFQCPASVAVDSVGNVFVADNNNHTIRKVTAMGVVTTLAGSAGAPGTNDGMGSAARFNGPNGVALDSAGNLLVADWRNHTIRKVTATGVVTTLAGKAGNPGSADGTGSAAQFNFPCHVAVDSAGNLFVADEENFTIRKVTPVGTNWVVTTLAGKAGYWGSADGTNSMARFSMPTCVAVDSADNVFVADYGNCTIRKMTPVGTNWVVTTLAGSAGAYGTNDGTGSAARFGVSGCGGPEDVAVDSAGNLFVADGWNYTIRKVTPVGTNWVVTTLAGSAGSYGSADGIGSTARFYYPGNVAVDSAGNMFVADSKNNTIRQVTPAGVVTTLAGNAGYYGSTDATGSAARLHAPWGVAVDSADNVFVADEGNCTIRKVTPAGVVTTLAGSAGASGTNDGTGSAARFGKYGLWGPEGVAVDSAGNLLVADWYNSTIRQVTSAGAVTTLAGLGGYSGANDGTGSAARFNGPRGVGVDTNGNVLVADTYNHTIRQVTRAGVVTTLAGSAGVSGTNDGTGNAARFYYPEGVAVDAAGNVFVADTYNHTIRQVTPVGTSWVVMTLAGLAGVSGTNDGTGSAALFYYPNGLAVDSAGNVFVADSGNNTIRKVTSTGVVTTIGGVAGVMSGADGIGSYAIFAEPCGVAVDSAGTVYVADRNNNRISKGTPIYPLLTAGFDGRHVQLSWPTIYLGWELQAQTNLPGAGLSTNWSSVASSTNNAQMSIPIDPACPSVFYRLHQQ